MNKQFPVRGVRELDRFLAAFPKRLETGAYKTALTAAAEPVLQEARLRAPKETGALARAIKKGNPRKNPDGTFSISVRLTGEDAYLGVFLEYGVAPHLIARKGGRRGRAGLSAAASQGEKVGGVLKVGDRYVTGIISHPGHVARPFLRPALDIKADEAVKAFADRIRSFIEQKTGFAAPTDEAA